MASSDTENKETAKAWHDSIKPSVVVDIGVGKGTYSKLCRAKGSKWIGIEAWGGYIEEFGLNELYDQVVISDIRYCDLKAVHESPDLVIIGDVLEHMPKADAQRVIAKLLAWGKKVMICVPMMHRAQPARNGNFFEIHVDHWHHEEMLRELKGKVFKQKKGRVLAYYLCNK